MPIISHHSFALSLSFFFLFLFALPRRPFFPEKAPQKRGNSLKCEAVVLIDLNVGANGSQTPRTEMNWQSSSLTGKSGNQRWSISSRNTLRYTPVEWRSRSPPPPPHIPLSWIMDAARATTIIVQFVPSDEGGRSVEIEQQQDRRNKRQRQQQNCWSENKSKITMPEWVGIFYCFFFLFVSSLTRRGVSTIINSIIDTSLVQLTVFLKGLCFG